MDILKFKKDTIKTNIIKNTLIPSIKYNYHLNNY